MKHIVRSIMFVALLSVVMACKEQQQNEIQYDKTELEAGDFVRLSLEEVPAAFFFSQPRQIEFVGDSLLVVYDAKPENGRLGHLFSLNGRCLGSFGMIGKGHGEMIYPSGISIGVDNQSIYFFDWHTSRSVKFLISDILSKKNVPYVISVTDSLSYELGRFNHVIQFSDADYVATKTGEDGRIVKVRDNKVDCIYSQYPAVDENEEYTWSIWGNYLWSKIGVSPDHKYLVNTTRIGMLFEILSMSDSGKIRSEVVKGFYKPEFGLAEGAKPACLTFTEKTIGGVSALYCAKESFFVVMDGPGFSHHDEIYEFNYAGELIHKYKLLDGEVVCLCVNSKREAYIIVMDDEGEQYLGKTKLQEV